MESKTKLKINHRRLSPEHQSSRVSTSTYIRMQDRDVNASANRPDRDKFQGHSGIVSSAGKEEVFVKWLSENGAKFVDRALLRCYENDVRGVHAARDLKAEEIIIEVPLKCLITVEMGKATDVGRAVLEAGLELDAPKHIFLMLFLLLDRCNSDSFFRPYYDVLPGSLSNMPIFWKPNELTWLEGSYLLVQIEERKCAIQNDFKAIVDAWPAFKRICTLDEFSWARMCVCSRNFGIVINGVRTSAMVPYADMLNHFRPRETKWTFDNTRGAFTITALQSIPSGGQIYDSYGQKCNHRFLLNYGFAVEDNYESDGYCPNEVALLVRLAPEDPLTARKRLIWIRDGAVGVKRIRLCASDNENFRACLSLLRVVAADEVELDRILSQNPYGTYRTASDIHVPVSFRNECAALSLLKHTCKSMLEAYPRSLAADKSAISSNALSPFSNERHACIHVKSEKLVLCHYINFAKTALNLARCHDGEFEATVSRLFDEPVHRHVASYCNGVVRQVRHAVPKLLSVESDRRQHKLNLSTPTIV